MGEVDFFTPSSFQLVLASASRFSTATNRITENFDGLGTPPAYAAAGNLTSHQWIGAMAYDAENHQTGFTSASGATTYQYDGDGRRVKKVQGVRTTVFVYDALGGNLAADYSPRTHPSEPHGGEGCLAWGGA